MIQAGQSRFWKRFKRNKAALVSIVLIALLTVIAFLAYPLSTDDSENANTIMLELSTRKPGFSCLLLKIRSSIPEEKSSFMDYLIHGHKANDNLIPVKSFQITTDSIIVDHILDEENTERLAFSKLSLQVDNTWSELKVSEHLFTKITYWLGTDKSGRDVLSRLILGSRVSLSVGFIAVILSISIGVLLGAASGYFGGFTDHVITWLINVLWAIPTLLLVFAITFVLGKGFWQIFIAVGCTMWVGTARLIRGQVMSIREMEYIQAAKVMGYSAPRIIVKHILPNVVGPTMVMAASNFATAILIEAGLSFLGIGVQPPVSSWGLMIKENYNFIITNRPLLAIIPGIAIMITVLAFNILGNALRDAFDVKNNTL